MNFSENIICCETHYPQTFYCFSLNFVNIINRKIHGCLGIPDLFLVLNMISHSFAVLTREISCSTLEINRVFPHSHVLFSMYCVYNITDSKNVNIYINIYMNKYIYEQNQHANKLPNNSWGGGGGGVGLAKLCYNFGKGQRKLSMVYLICTIPEPPLN